MSTPPIRDLNNLDPHLWVYDKTTGEKLAEIELPSNASGAPITYMAGGKQYIAFPVGGGPVPEELIAVGLRVSPIEGEVGMSSQRVSGTAVQRTIAVLGSAVFFVVAPFTLAGLVPWSITGWQLRPPFLGLELTRGIGAIMILAGVPGLVDAFARFALQGLGTPAPIAPPRNLVVTGLYRYVRNPIYVAVVAIILGQAVLMGDWRLIVYGALLWLVFHVFVVAYEEPTLERTFGREYEAFRAAVPRWIPRMTPWRSK